MLVRLQQERWDPILNWVRDRFSVEIKTFDGILGATQSTDTLSALGARLALMDGWTLAAFERAVMTTKSFMIALMLVDGHLSVEQASKAAEVEVASQIERWGEVEDTHDVDFQDVRRQLGSVAAMLVTTSPEHAKTVASVSS